MERTQTKNNSLRRHQKIETSQKRQHVTSDVWRTSSGNVAAVQHPHPRANSRKMRRRPCFVWANVFASIAIPEAQQFLPSNATRSWWRLKPSPEIHVLCLATRVLNSYQLNLVESEFPKDKFLEQHNMLIAYCCL